MDWMAVRSQTFLVTGLLNIASERVVVVAFKIRLRLNRYHCEIYNYIYIFFIIIFKCTVNEGVKSFVEVGFLHSDLLT